MLETGPRVRSRAEQAAWGGLEELRADLRRYLGQRCRDESEIDDVVQETLLRAARYRERLTEPAKLLPWARRIAANVLCDRVRKERRLDRVRGQEGMLEAVPATASAPGAAADDGGEVRCGSFVLDKHTALEVLAGELGALRSEDRELLVAFYGGAESCREAAETCDVPLSLVKVRLFRARRRLLRAMRRRLAHGLPPGCRIEV